MECRCEILGAVRLIEYASACEMLGISKCLFSIAVIVSHDLYIKSALLNIFVSVWLVGKDMIWWIAILEAGGLYSFHNDTA